MVGPLQMVTYGKRRRNQRSVHVSNQAAQSASASGSEAQQSPDSEGEGESRKRRRTFSAATSKAPAPRRKPSGVKSQQINAPKPRRGRSAAQKPQPFQVQEELEEGSVDDDEDDSEEASPAPERLPMRLGADTVTNFALRMMIAILFGRLRSKQEGQQYSIWGQVFDAIFAGFDDEFFEGSLQALDGATFYLTDTHYQLPATARLASWIKKLLFETNNIKDRLTRALSRRIPDLTRMLYLVETRLVNGNFAIHLKAERRILIAEIKALDPGAPDREAQIFAKLNAARAQAKEQAQYVFSEHPDMNYIGVIVGCDNEWMYYEHYRKDLPAAGWSNPLYPRHVKLDLEPVLKTPPSSSPAVPRKPIKNRAPLFSEAWSKTLFVPSSDPADHGATPYWQKRTFTRESKARAPHPGPPPEHVELGKLCMDPPNFLKDIAPKPAPGRQYAFFTLQDREGRSDRALKEIAKKLKAENSDFCNQSTFSGPPRSAASSQAEGGAFGSSPLSDAPSD
ncbi:hypothetical protein EIP91_001936 [Steccherinum ochraceum]|uniref:Uncharacterized protein n=1 Tax=Steccherinum ochraceum TaxID=92696 RepID=A0A4R0RLI5_9APHY|nr:hypothetical protein EIP91_001936 [Steccherinum ochraceum]